MPAIHSVYQTKNTREKILLIFEKNKTRGDGVPWDLLYKCAIHIPSENGRKPSAVSGILKT